MVELLLVVSLIALLAGVTVLSVSALGASGADEDRVRLESIIAVARSKAAADGRNYRLSADEEGVLVIEVESEPGQFGPCRDNWASMLPEGLRLESCRYAGTDVWRQPSDDQEAPEPTLGFYPDGSSDSVVLELGLADPDQSRRLRLTVDGFSGRIGSEWLYDEGE
jgi:hypothetical protein